MKYRLFSTESLVIVITNLIPLFGVLLLSWQLRDVVLLFFFETIVIGIFNMLKMAVAKPSRDNPAFLRFILIPFFASHYNFFILGQGIFIMILIVLPEYKGVNIFAQEVVVSGGLESIISFFSPYWQYAWQGRFPLVFAYFAIIISHLFDFVYHFIIKKERERPLDVGKMMFAPYRRIFVQQFVIIFGAFLFLTFETPLVFLALLIVLKIFIDLRTHYDEHKVLQVQDEPNYDDLN